MVEMHIIFWISLACVGYVYVGYPLLLRLGARFRPASHARGPFTGSFMIVVSAHNEEAGIERRLEELAGLLPRSGLNGEILLVSDGSTDATAERAKACGKIHAIGVLEFQENVGKAAALTLACRFITKDVIVFADVRQTWAEDALPRLLENFADPRVGAVSGDLVLQTTGGVLAGVGLYWRFEKWLRKTESLIWSQVGVTGAISAVRRELFRPIPQGTILDDVYWPLCVAMQGYRVIHDERAVAYDRLPDRPRDEFRRKVRTLSGNYQLAWRLPGSLLPWRNPVWPAWISHKLLRLAVPWALLALLVCSTLLPGVFYQVALGCQLVAYSVALLGLVPAIGGRMRLVGAAASFLVLNAAALLAFWVSITGRASKSWHKVSYEPFLGAAARIPDAAHEIPQRAGGVSPLI